MEGVLNCYDGLSWVWYNHRPKCDDWIDKTFPDYWTINYNYEGEVTLQLDDGPVYTLKSPVVWISFPGQRFRFGKKQGTWYHSHLSFRGPRIQKYLQEGLLSYDSDYPVIKISEPLRLLNSIKETIDYLDAPIYGDARGVQMLEGVLLMLLEQKEINSAQSDTEKKVLKIINQVSNSPSGLYDWKAISATLKLSYSHFRRLFIKLTQLPPHRFQMQKKLEMSCRMLREGKLEVKHIAETLGFSDVSHFTRLFRRHTGLTPYRFKAGGVIDRPPYPTHFKSEEL